MSFDAGSIISRLTLDKEGFTSGILSANALTQTFGSHITAFMANPLIEAGNLLKELGTTLWDWGKEAAEAANGQRRMAEAMGSSVEFVGGLEYAFKRCHVPVEMMRLEMSRLVHDMASADSGATPAGRALAELGISARDSSGQMRPMKDVLLEVADAISKVPNATQRAALAQDLFGKSGMNLLPVLMKGRAGIADFCEEAKRLGLTFTDDQTESAKAYEEALGDIEAAWTGLKRQVGAEVFKELTPLFKDMAAHAPEISHEIVEITKGLVALLPSLTKVVELMLKLSESNGIVMLGKAINYFSGDSKGSASTGTPTPSKPQENDERKAADIANAVERRMVKVSGGIVRSLDRGRYQEVLVNG